MARHSDRTASGSAPVCSWGGKQWGGVSVRPPAHGHPICAVLVSPLEKSLVDTVRTSKRCRTGFDMQGFYWRMFLGGSMPERLGIPSAR